MLYLNADHIREIGIHWEELTDVISNATTALHQEDYAQPIKPYLRYGDPKNRIIAMPAYVGGQSPLAGIKWIASFPGNIYQNKLRAHSVTILNEHDSGIPLCVINTATISGIRTAAVSGVILKKYLANRKDDQQFTVGIIGFGPIGRMHLSMVTAILGDRIDRVLLYDINGVDLTTVDPAVKDKVAVANSWQECYSTADIFITCTVSAAPYVDLPPVKSSLQLNVSLRDYKVEMVRHMDVVVVDDWEEVCRQNTDIENMHKVMGLEKTDTLSIADVVCNDALKGQKEGVVMFNPMGMAIYDIAVGGHYYQQALHRNVGVVVPD
ncbi:2,3-diaminopropionate biosynthesis protein SbnB [Chitinophaga qingshengii]|uniref:2,3-diaminopropionate biosynthesis protein SbnB n=1 Tax=Chitinophaga qingshengii TaxID=1569794 RepID=A0ABR7TS67_9BACT|nr:2,3-diaminopropionate biosynthesis protein SbnB [Chitinophaga qingshengii]MBC9932838.1 2,3-diaminopropionate biosynthesis protein SbnB [Chitinophaga qingshengii]